jgi:cytoskeletal protein CcmA (bactofilin family)
LAVEPTNSTAQPILSQVRGAQTKEGFQNMWQTLDTPKSPSSPNPTPAAPASNASSTVSAQLRTTAEQATIGRSLVIKGEVSGSEPLYVDGRIEGTINLTDNRVTIGRNGTVSANINAKEVVVMGKLSGNVTVTDRVDIRAEGSVTGDVVAHRLSIEDGAFFKGSVDLRKSDKPHVEPKKNNASHSADSNLSMAATAGKA